MGSRFGGHALYIKNNRLHYVNNFVGSEEQKIDATEDIPTGENVILSASFDKEGEDPPGVANGILSLYYGDKKVGEGRIKTQPGKFSIARRGPVRRPGQRGARHRRLSGRRAVAFTGGTIRQVASQRQRQAVRGPRARGRRP